MRRGNGSRVGVPHHGGRAKAARYRSAHLNCALCTDPPNRLSRTLLGGVCELFCRTNPRLARPYVPGAASDTGAELGLSLSRVQRVRSGDLDRLE